MTEKPLSYPCRKVLLEHLDFNIRFQLVKRAPALQKMDKVIPRHIDYLCFDNMKMMINDTEYKLGTLRHYDTKVDNKRVIYVNRNGGVPYDLTASGLEDEAFNELTPGDIQIRAELDDNEGKQRQREDVQRRKRLEDIIQVQEAALLRRDPGDPLEDMRILEDILRLESHRDFFDSMYNRHHIQPPQRTFIQLTISFFGGPVIERFSRENEKLHNADKYLASRLFGNAYENTVHVKRFVVYSDYTTTCLPENLKLKISVLQTIGDFKNLNHPAIKSAKKLHLSCLIPLRQRFEILSNLQNKMVHFDNNCWLMNDWIRIVKQWIQESKEVGTCFTFADSQVRGTSSWCSAIMNNVIDQIGGEKVDKNCITVPMSITSELRLSYEPILYNKWAFKMEVIGLEQAN